MEYQNSNEVKAESGEVNVQVKVDDQIEMLSLSKYATVGELTAMIEQRCGEKVNNLVNFSGQTLEEGSVLVNQEAVMKSSPLKPVIAQRNANNLSTEVVMLVTPPGKSSIVFLTKNFLGSVTANKCIGVIGPSDLPQIILNEMPVTKKDFKRFKYSTGMKEYSMMRSVARDGDKEISPVDNRIQIVFNLLD